jgi:hypothetical protein
MLTMLGIPPVASASYSALDATASATVTATATHTLTPTALPSSTAVPTATITPTLLPLPDLIVALVDAPDPVIQGGTVTYTMTVTNNGKGASGATTALLNVPDGTTLFSIGAGCALTDDGVSCQVPALAAAAKATFTVAVQVTGGTGVLTAIATVDPLGSIVESDKSNNRSPTTTIVGMGTPATSTPTPRTTLAPATPTPGAATPTPAASMGIAAGATDDLWLLILGQIDITPIRDGAATTAPAGAWFHVFTQDGNWVLAAREGDLPANSAWIQIDSRVQLVGGARKLPAPPPDAWLVVQGPSQTYSMAGTPQWIAGPGERYRVIKQEQGWALVIWEGDLPSAMEWIQIDSRVQITTSDGT